jgi:hypothetical protein
VSIKREEKHPILESLSAGAVFGLLSIIEHKPRSAYSGSAVQHLLVHLLAGRFAETRIIATTTAIAAATHLYMKSLVSPFLIIVPNISSACF